MRLTVPFASAATASVLALGAAGCGDESEQASTAATQAPSSTTTQANSPPPDAADFLGATLTSTTAGKPGAVVQAVQPDSKSRLKPGDVIIAFNGTRVTSADDLVPPISVPT